MSINVQLMQTLIQLQAFQSMNDAQPSDSILSNGTSESFASMLTALLTGNASVTQDQSSSTLPFDFSTLSGIGSGNNLNMMALQSEAAQSLSMNNNSVDPTDFDSYIAKASAKYNVDPKLIRSVIRHESSFDPTSVSSAGAIGLMQLMPGTARGLGINDPFDPKENIDGGTKYLRQLLDTFDNNEALAVAAYNAGPANVKKYGGIPPFPETQNYVHQVLQSYMS